MYGKTELFVVRTSNDCAWDLMARNEKGTTYRILSIRNGRLERASNLPGSAPFDCTLVGGKIKLAKGG